jgi:hypothetical protein
MIPAAEVWFPAVTLILGAFLAFVSEALRDRRAARREVSLLAERRHDDAQRARVEFQRPTLIALQEEIHKMGRLAGRIHHHNLMNGRNTGTFGTSHLPDDLNEDFALCARTVAMLRVRAADDEIRALTKAVVASFVAILFAADRDTAEKLFSASNDPIDTFNERLGVVLRSLDEVSSIGG